MLCGGVWFVYGRNTVCTTSKLLSIFLILHLYSGLKGRSHSVYVKDFVNASST